MATPEELGLTDSVQGSSLPSASTAQPKGVLGKGFDLIDRTFRRPQSALFTVAGELASGQGLRTALESGFDELATFRRRMTFRGIMEAGGVPEFWGDGVVSFAGDIFLDPLFLVPFRKIGKLGKEGFRIAKGWGPHAISALERLPFITPSKLDTVSQGLKRFNDARKRLTKGAATAVGLEGVMAKATVNRRLRALSGELQTEAYRDLKVIQKLAKEYDMDPEVLHKSLISMIEMSDESLLALKHKDLLKVESRSYLSEIDEPLGYHELLKFARDKAGSKYDPSRFMMRADGTPIPEDAFRVIKEAALNKKDKYAALLRKDAEVVARTGFGVRKFEKLNFGEQQARISKTLNEMRLGSERIDYMAHLIHPKARKHLMRNVPELSGLRRGVSWNPEHASLLSRKLKDFSILELNELSMAGKLDFMPAGVPLFISDPNMIDAVRAYRTGRAVTISKFLDQTVREHGWEVAGQTKKGGLTVKSIKTGEKVELRGQDLIQAEIDGYKGLFLPKEIKDGITSYVEKSSLPEEVQKAGQLYTSAVSTWKLWTLAPFPEYHARNVVGNTWNMFLSGLTNPIEYASLSAQSMQIQRLANKMNFIDDTISPFVGKATVKETVEKILPDLVEEGVISKAAGKVGHVAHGVKFLKTKNGKDIESLDDVLKFGKEEVSVKDFLQEMFDEGVMTSGFFGAEVTATNRGVQAGTNALARQASGGPGTVIKSMGDVGRTLETNARISLYLKNRHLGKEEAANIVQKYLFNYDNPDKLTQIARNVAFPFFTWTRYNVPLQLEHLIMDPAKTTIINRMRASIEASASADRNEDERYAVEWIRQGMNIRVARDGFQSYKVFVLDNWIPLADLAEIGIPQLEKGVGAFAGEVGEWALQMLNPFIKAPVEFATGYSFFNKRPYLPEKREFLGVNMSERMSNVLRNVRLLSVLDRFIVAPPNSNLKREAFKTLTGISLRTVDISKGKEAHEKAVAARIKELESAKRRALRKDNEAAARDLQKEIDKLLDPINPQPIE